MSADVLILDGETRAALAVCRSLGSKGLDVAVMNEGPAQSSKYTKEKIPSTYSLEEAVKLIRPKMLLPITDKSLERCLELNLEGVLFPFPQKQTVELVLNKASLMELASSCGIQCPETAVVQRSSPLSWKKFPAVIKPVKAGYGDFKVRYISNKVELREIISSLAEGIDYLLQEKIEGTGVGVFALMQEGRSLATFAHKRLLEKPPSGGVSVLSESIALDDAPVNESLELLRKLGWSGVAMIEYKKSEHGFFLMEVNPRFWGTTQLSVSSGVDFPWLLWQLASGELKQDDLERAKNYKTGLRLRWDLGTLDYLIIRGKETDPLDVIRRNELELFSTRDIVHETFSRSDPQPFFMELKSYLKALRR